MEYFGKISQYLPVYYVMNSIPTHSVVYMLCPRVFIFQKASEVNKELWVTELQGLTERYETNKIHVTRVTIIFCFNGPKSHANYEFTEERGCPNTLKDLMYIGPCIIVIVVE